MQLGLHENLIILQFGLQQRKNLTDHLVDVKQRFFPAVVLEHRPNAVDHLAGPMTGIGYPI